MYICSQCGKSGKKLWLSKNGLCEKCAWKVYSGLSAQEREALERGISPLDPDYEEKLDALDAQPEPYDTVAIRRPQKQLKPLYKTWWVYALVGVIIAAVVIVILLTRAPSEGGMGGMEGDLNMGMPGGDALGDIMFE